MKNPPPDLASDGAPMPVPPARRVIPLAVLAILTGCATNPSKSSDNIVSQFSEMSAAKFTLRVDAPAAIVREYAVCKAVWFADKQHKSGLSLSNPNYSIPTSVAPGLAPVPEGWTRLTTIAYLSGPNPDGNPTFLIADKAPGCRTAFDWYH